MMMGWDHQKDVPTLPWMSGHLLRWRWPTRTHLFKGDELVVGLLQMRSLGRALPCPSRLKTIETLVKSSAILRQPDRIPSNALSCVKHFATLLGERLGVKTMPTDTHISVSTSATVSFSKSDGGKASEMKAMLDSFKALTLGDTLLAEYNIPNAYQSMPLWDYLQKNGIVYDIYGEPLFYSDWLHQYASREDYVYRDTYGPAS